jgi:hypothetical protein
VMESPTGILPGTGRWRAAGVTEGPGLILRSRAYRIAPDPSDPPGHLPVPGRINRQRPSPVGRGEGALRR